jgi:hypothetical protein
MANFVSATDFKVFIVPIVASIVDSDGVSGGVLEDVDGFIDITTIVDDAEPVTEGTLPDIILIDDENIVNGAQNVADDATIAVDTVFELLGITDASFETATKSDEVITYSDGGGYSQGVATSKNWRIKIEGVTDFTSAGYKAMRIVEKNNVSGNLRVKIGRTTPAGENVYGYATLKSFNEKSKAGTIVSYTVEADGYGSLGLSLATVI